MRISKDDLVGGIPGPQARQLMRSYNRDGASAHVAAEELNLTLEDASTLLDEFVKLGFLEKGRPHYDGDSTWCTTTSGNALAQASLRTIKRGTAEKNLAASIARIKEYNRDPEKLLSITRLEVFGSYTKPSILELGDLDLAAEIYARFDDNDEFHSASDKYTKKSGRRFSNIVEQLFWPTRELRMVIKGRTSSVHVIDCEELEQLGSTKQTVYTHGSDGGAIELPHWSHSVPN